MIAIALALESWFAGTMLKSSRSTRPHCALELLAELGQLIRREVADRPVVQSALAPAPDIESLQRLDFGGAAFGAGGLGYEQVDHMRAPPVDDGASRARIDIIEPAADQRKTLRGEIDHRRRHVELAVEPRFYRVPVGGQHVGEMSGLQGAQMRRNHFGLDSL